MASLNLNKVILCGRLTADVELKQTQSGVSVCSFSLAVNRKYSKEGEQATDFINIVAWRNTAEFITKYFKKGNAICICGQLQTRSWTAQDGSKRYATEVLAEEASFVERRAEAGNPAPNFTSEPAAPRFEEVSADEDLPF
jgi:single-strand DNA-binding protein